MWTEVLDRLEELGLQPEVTLGVSAGIIVALGTFLVGRRILANRPDAFGLGPVSEPRRDPFVAGSASERRHSNRRKGITVPIALADAEGKDEPIIAVVHDRSMGGLGILADQAFAAGVLLKVRPMNAPLTTPWVDVEVKNCEPQGSRWHLGCSFLQTPPWGVLLLFG
jgi:hypothetical protein